MATVIGQRQTVTAEELQELSQAGRSCELVKGELREMPPGGEEHGYRGMRLPGHLAAYVYANNLGEVSLAETGVLLERGPDSLRAPDMGFIARDRLPVEPSPTWSEIVPDLVIEVVSPNESWSEVTDKVQQWLAAGVRVAWVVDNRARTVTVCRAVQPWVTLTETDTLEGGDVVPGFSLPVARIFAWPNVTPSPPPAPR
jgi:Uma2 family endonuclease